MGVGLLVAAAGIVYRQVVTKQGVGYGLSVAIACLLVLAGIGLSVGSAIAMFNDDPTISETISERAALRCAEKTGIKPSQMTEAQADPDEPLLRAPWDDDELWGFTDLEAIDCGSHMVGVRAPTRAARAIRLSLPLPSCRRTRRCANRKRTRGTTTPGRLSVR